MDSLPDLTPGPGKVPIFREQMKRNREGGEGMGTRSERVKREDESSIKASFPFLLFFQKPLSTKHHHHTRTTTVCRSV